MHYPNSVPHYRQIVTSWVALVTMLLWSLGVQCCCVGASCCNIVMSVNEDSGFAKSCCSRGKSSSRPTTVDGEEESSGARMCACTHESLPEVFVAKSLVLAPGLDSWVEDPSPEAPVWSADSLSFQKHLCGPPGARGPPVV